MEKETMEKETTTSIALKTEAALELFRDEKKALPTGMEELSLEDFKVPIVKIAQALSPAMRPDEPQYIEGLKLGQFYNSATKKNYGDSLQAIVLSIRPVLLGWKPKRAGFAGRFSVKDRHKIIVTPEGVFPQLDQDGNEIQYTLEYCCVDPKNPRDLFLLSFSVTHLKHAKAFNSLIDSIEIEFFRNGKTIKEKVGATWAGVWNIKTQIERKDANSWYVIKTPVMERFITMEERNNIIIPALERMGADMEPDYSDQDDLGAAPAETGAKPIY